MPKSLEATPSFPFLHSEHTPKINRKNASNQIGMNSNPTKVKTSASKLSQDDSCKIDETHSGTKCAPQNRNPFLYGINKHGKINEITTRICKYLEKLKIIWQNQRGNRNPFVQILVFQREKEEKRRGRERWGRKCAGERDGEENGQLCGEENEKMRIRG
jgi:hypothetical protein